LKELYGEVLGQWNRYMGHVRSNIGGIYENDKTYEQKGPVYTHVEKLKQKTAVKFINDQAFATPTWMLDQNILNKFDNAGIVDRLRRTQVGVLNGILDFSRLSRLIDNSVKNGANAYSMPELFSDLRNGIWTELKTGANMDTYRRNLQRAYIERVSFLLNENEAQIPAQFAAMAGPQIDVSQSEIRPMARQELKTLAAQVKASLPKYANPVIKSHLEDVLVRIEDALNPKK
jgi:hypothetical protein